MTTFYIYISVQMLYMLQKYIFMDTIFKQIQRAHEKSLAGIFLPPRAVVWLPLLLRVGSLLCTKATAYAKEPNLRWGQFNNS